MRGAAEVASAAFSPTTGVWESLQATLFVSKLHLLRFVWFSNLLYGLIIHAEPGTSSQLVLLLEELSREKFHQEYLFLQGTP